MHVAVGLVFDAHGKILISKRPIHKFKGGLWEFPGGKVEEGETALQALQREFLEEVGIQIMTATPWMQIPSHVYLDIYQVNEYSGKAFGRENQEILWVDISALSQFTFPEENGLIIEKLNQF
jgi:8-oxo-dGTP diphosphatase